MRSPGLRCLRLVVKCPMRPKNGSPESPLGSELPYGDMNMHHFTTDFDAHIEFTLFMLHQLQLILI
jgi:hypothetical protein